MVVSAILQICWKVLDFCTDLMAHLTLQVLKISIKWPTSFSMGQSFSIEKIFSSHEKQTPDACCHSADCGRRRARGALLPSWPSSFSVGLSIFPDEIPRYLQRDGNTLPSPECERVKLPKPKPASPSGLRHQWTFHLAQVCRACRDHLLHNTQFTKLEQN